MGLFIKLNILMANIYNKAILNKLKYIGKILDSLSIDKIFLMFNIKYIKVKKLSTWIVFIPGIIGGEKIKKNIYILISITKYLLNIRLFFIATLFSLMCAYLIGCAPA